MITANTSTKNQLNSREPNRPRVSREIPRIPGSSMIRGRGGGPGGQWGMRGWGIVTPGLCSAGEPSAGTPRADDEPSSEQAVTPPDGRPGSAPDRGAPDVPARRSPRWVRWTRAPSRQRLGFDAPRRLQGRSSLGRPVPPLRHQGRGHGLPTAGRSEDLLARTARGVNRWPTGRVGTVGPCSEAVPGTPWWTRGLPGSTSPCRCRSTGAPTRLWSGRIRPHQRSAHMSTCARCPAPTRSGAPRGPRRSRCRRPMTRPGVGHARSSPPTGTRGHLCSPDRPRASPDSPDEAPMALLITPVPVPPALIPLQPSRLSVG